MSGAPCRRQRVEKREEERVGTHAQDAMNHSMGLQGGEEVMVGAKMQGDRECRGEGLSGLRRTEEEGGHVN